ncbi:hypothetical protein WJX73_008145 [Symbiochloris irregularis]|uniref:Uncharacterized protein n=1 Tax=Symbiochloris irregularis TaxID=706552 RepID=A0AAW1NTB9_9CHLO
MEAPDFESVEESDLPSDLRQELWQFIPVVFQQRSCPLSVGHVKHHGLVTLSYQPSWPASAYVNIFEDEEFFPDGMLYSVRTDRRTIKDDGKYHSLRSSKFNDFLDRLRDFVVNFGEEQQRNKSEAQQARAAELWAQQQAEEEAYRAADKARRQQDLRQSQAMQREAASAGNKRSWKDPAEAVSTSKKHRDIKGFSWCIWQ